MYNYFYIKTDCRSNTWKTMEIQNYLQSFTIFEEKSNGIFTSKNPFLDISLLKVKDLNSWSSLDFDKDETNYVPIVTSGEWCISLCEATKQRKRMFFIDVTW